MYIQKFILFTLLIPSLSFGQDSVRIESNVSKLPFYKWEVSVDLLPLIDKSKDAFGYLVKRNFLAANGKKSLRFKLLPRLLSGPGDNAGSSEKQSALSLAVGYERQKTFGNFAMLYGVEPFFRHSKIRVKSNTNSSLLFEQDNTILGTSGFIGGRYYVSNHVNFTIESHLIYQYQNFNGSDYTLVSYSSRTHQLFVEPTHAIYVSYQF